MTSMEGSDKEHWTARGVTWAHLIIALVLMFSAGLSVIVGYLMADERWKAIIEERQRGVLSYIEKNTAAMELVRMQLVALQMQAAQHQARDDESFQRKASK